MSIESIIKLIPDYIERLLKLLGGPRQFFKDRDPNADGALVDSLRFLFISTILAFILRMPAVADVEAYLKTSVVTVVFYLLTALAMGSLAFGCCRLVGGKAALQSHITIFSYLGGVSALFFALAKVVSSGVVKHQMPDQFGIYATYMQEHFPDRKVLKEDTFSALAEGPALDLSIWILFGGIVIIVVWMITAWRAYWDLNNLSRTRGIAALGVFLVAGYALNYVLGLAQLSSTHVLGPF